MGESVVVDGLPPDVKPDKIIRSTNGILFIAVQPIVHLL